MPKMTHMTFQTEWMAEQLLTRVNGGVYKGGLLSDVTYKFFANGYLLLTSMYNEVLHCWIPIQLTWMNGLTDDHYLAHFTTLLQQIKDSQFSISKCDTLVRQCVDFSMAQKNGFIGAYMKVFNESDRNVALSKLTGCKEHFRAQVTHVKRNNAIIARGYEVSFLFNYLNLHFS